MYTVEPTSVVCIPGRRGYRDRTGGPDEVPHAPPEQREAWTVAGPGLTPGELLGIAEDGRQRMTALANLLNHADGRPAVATPETSESTGPDAADPVMAAWKEAT